MSGLPPTIDDQIRWVEELVGFQTRQYRTLVETGRMTETDAARKSALTLAVLSTLQQARPDSATILVDASREGRLKTPTALIQFSCGAAYENIAMMNCDLILADAAVRQAFLMQLGDKLCQVIDAGMKRAAG
tara:strand:+ start:2197 stop:2592 length:396 start_codon:yes stop_codon:yes gene_type:complete